MLTKWSPELAARVSNHVAAILIEPQSHPSSEVEATRRTRGLPVYGDLGGIIALTSSGDFVSYNSESETVTPVQESLWQDVALASLAKHYPDLRELLPARPARAPVCPSCSGCGWMMGGSLFCRRCRGLGWVE